MSHTFVTMPTRHIINMLEGMNNEKLDEMIAIIKNVKSSRRENKSACDSPVKRVFQIADSMQGKKRSEIIAACVEAGVNIHTAKTQYQIYFAVRQQMNKAA